MARKLTQAELDSVIGLSSRQAAEVLGCSKTTVNDARKLAREHGGLLPQHNKSKKTEDSTDIEIVSSVPITETQISEALKARGIDEATHKVSLSFGIYEQGEKVRHSFRASASPKRIETNEATEFELQSVIDRITSYDHTKEFHMGAGDPNSDTLVIVPADLQIGKVDWNGGTDDTIKQALESFARAAQFATEHNFREIVIVDAGDIIENIYNVSSQLGTNDVDLPHQVVLASHVILSGIEMLAPLCESLRYVAVSSNHGAHRIGLKAPGGDVHADYGIAIARMLDRALKLNPVAFGHVTVQVPEPFFESLYFKTLSNSDIGVVHGHQVNSPDKIGEWWKGQSHGNMPVGNARILITGHWHSLRVQQSGDSRWIIVGPSSDRGSSWFTNNRGERSESGMLMFTTKDNKWGNLQIV